MVDETLLKYIKTQIERGYSIKDISSFLIQRGYSEQSINDCLKHIYNNPSPQPHPKKTKHPFIVLIVIFSIIIGLVSFFIFFMSDAEQDVSIDLRLQMVKPEIQLGEQISFQRVIGIDGAREDISVRVVYTIKNEAGNVIHTQGENILTSMSSTDEVLINFPMMSSGTYTINAEANYLGQTITQSSQFYVSPKQQDELDDDLSDDEPTVAQCPLFYDDGDKCTRAICGPETNFIPIYEDIVPCCGNNICEQGETQENCPEDCGPDSKDSYFDEDVTVHVDFVGGELSITQEIEKIRELSKTNRGRAVNLCDAIVLPFYRDECFYAITQEIEDEQLCSAINEQRTRDKCYTRMSQAKQDTSLCGMITSELRADSCYMTFALQGDYSICGLIKDRFYAQSCNQLSEISKISPEAIEEYAQTVR